MMHGQKNTQILYSVTFFFRNRLPFMT